jgi:hypothetical protein
MRRSAMHRMRRRSRLTPKSDCWSTQAERAVQQYKPLLDEEAVQLGKNGAEAVAKDREVVHALEVALMALKKQPQGFNSRAGFA